MKIVYATNDSDLVHDGRFLEKYVESGYEVHYVSFIRREIKDSEKIPGIIYYNYPIDKKSQEKKYPRYLYPFRYLKFVFILKKILKKVKPDILHGGFIQISGVISSLSDYKPFILMPWGHDVLKYKEMPLYLKLITRFAVTKSDCVAVDAEFVKSKVSDFFNYDEKNIVVFPWGVDRKIFNPQIKSNFRENFGWSDKKIIIMTRGFDPRMDVETLINAIPKIVAKNKDARFLLMGASHLSAKKIGFVYDKPAYKATELNCKNLVLKLGIAKYVRFVKFMPNKEVAAFISNSDIFVSTSLSDGSSLSLMEGISCGLPVIVTKVPAFREWVSEGKNGHFINFGDSDALSNKINSLLANKDKLKSMSLESLQVAEEKADWDKNFNILQTTYNKLKRRKSS